MATAVEISRSDMNDFLVPQNFREVQVPGTKERVYSKFVDEGLCLRVYTSVVGESSRDVGEDAIRCVLVTKVAGQVKIVGGDRRVHRVEGWRKNLQNRLDSWQEQLGPACPKCRAATVRKQSKRGPFWGCCRYPDCKTVQPIQVPRRNPVREAAPPHQDEFDQHRAAPTPNRLQASEQAWRERMEEKAEYARLEAEQERRAYREEMEAELRANGIYDEDEEPLVTLADPPPANW